MKFSPFLYALNEENVAVTGRVRSMATATATTGGHG